MDVSTDASVWQGFGSQRYEGDQTQTKNPLDYPASATPVSPDQPGLVEVNKAPSRETVLIELARTLLKHRCAKCHMPRFFSLSLGDSLCVCVCVYVCVHVWQLYGHTAG